MAIKINNLPQTKKLQQGVVLIVSLVFLVALTAVASALMLNTSSDMKMSGSSQVKVNAVQEAISSIDEVVYAQIQGNTNAFTASQFPISMNAVVTSPNTTANITTVNTNSLVVDCPHSKLASSTAVFKCNVLRVQANKLYGRSNTSNVQVNAGVAQQLLNIGG
ncbi:MAG: pilus assembly PilX N-terminal domain-containing protein [Colwellia sp.]|nr:pilus assembly PilX N-terminal domain-containing protein [Colwellia sp.]MCW9080098.1 pilus assembly PilX N-terminal domain-containing protein [Colwellia sp.]